MDAPKKGTAGTAHCPGPAGSHRGPSETGINPYCDGWAFFACPRLGVGLFYADTQQHLKPQKKICVIVPDLGIRTDVVLCGVGEEGYETLVGMGEPYDDPIFPVDLFANPKRLHPRPSRRVSQAHYERWQALVQTLAAPRHRQRDRPAEDRGTPPDQLTAAIAAQLKIGMTRAEVVELFGPPHETGGTSRKQRVPLVYKYDTPGPWHVQISFGPGEQGGLAFAHAELDGPPHTHVSLVREPRRRQFAAGGVQ